MKDQVKEYIAFLRQFSSLQRKLVPIFESAVTIDLGFLEELHQSYDRPIPDEPNIPDLLECLAPDDTSFPVIMAGMLKPRKGVLQCEGEHWLFYMHGLNEIRFWKLPSDLSPEVLDALREGHTDALSAADMKGLPVVDVTYLREGCTSGMRAWAVYLYAQSIDSEFTTLELDEHRELLETLVEKGILSYAPPGGDGPHYIFASAE